MLCEDEPSRHAISYVIYYFIIYPITQFLVILPCPLRASLGTFDLRLQILCAVSACMQLIQCYHGYPFGCRLFSYPYLYINGDGYPWISIMISVISMVSKGSDPQMKAEMKRAAPGGGTLRCRPSLEPSADHARIAVSRYPNYSSCAAPCEWCTIRNSTQLWIQRHMHTTLYTQASIPKNMIFVSTL